MADLLRYVGARIGVSGTDKELKLILGVLDEALRVADPETENAIAVSFVEHIETEPFFKQLEPLLGPRLRAEHRRQVQSANAR